MPVRKQDRVRELLLGSLPNTESLSLPTPNEVQPPVLSELEAPVSPPVPTPVRAPAPAPEHTPVPSAPRPARWSVPPGPAALAPPAAVRGLYRRLGTTLALVGAALVAGVIWYFSGIFTLDFLGDMVAPLARLIATAPAWQVWFIPLAISAMELFLWPHRERRTGILVIRLTIWLCALLFDILTTSRGILPLLAQVELPLSITPDERTWLTYAVCVAVGTAFAYLPERTARWVLADLWALWVAPLWRSLEQRLDNVEAAG